MGLKELLGVGVVLHTKEELDEYLHICEAGGWVWNSGAPPTTPKGSHTPPLSIGAANKLTAAGKDYNWRKGTITLTEFKKEQGIMSMKYSVGDVLENDVDCTLTIEGIIGRVYIGIDNDDEAIMYSESELEDYTLKTDEPELVTLTMEDIAKREGIPVERLRIKD